MVCNVTKVKEKSKEKIQGKQRFVLGRESTV